MAEYDLLVGADGANSVVRAKMLQRHVPGLQEEKVLENRVTYKCVLDCWGGAGAQSATLRSAAASQQQQELCTSRSRCRLCGRSPPNHGTTRSAVSSARTV